jgi:hypothetical protein
MHGPRVADKNTPYWREEAPVKPLPQQPLAKKPDVAIVGANYAGCQPGWWALASGLPVHSRRYVTSIKEGEGLRVVTSAGTVQARQVLVCTDGYTDGAIPFLRRRLVPVRSRIIATEELAPEVEPWAPDYRFRPHGERRDQTLDLTRSLQPAFSRSVPSRRLRVAKAHKRQSNYGLEAEKAMRHSVPIRLKIAPSGRFLKDLLERVFIVSPTRGRPIHKPTAWYLLGSGMDVLWTSS